MCFNRTTTCAESTEKVNVVLLADKYFQESRFGFRILDHTVAISSGSVYIIMIVVF